MTPDLRFEWVTTTAGLEALRDDWTRLCADDLGVFRSWEWQATWWRILGAAASRCRDLRVLVARDDGGARAILPMYVEERWIGPFRRRHLRLLADGVVGSDYLGLVARPHDMTALAPVLARRLAHDAYLEDVDAIRFDDFVNGDALSAAVEASLASEFTQIDHVRRYCCPYVRLDGTFQEYLAERPRGFGAQFQRRRKWLRREHQGEVAIASTAQEVDRALDGLFALHRLRWDPMGGSQAIPDDRYETFHREAGRALAGRGWVRLATIAVGGRAVAATYCFATGTNWQYYQSGLDPEWRQRSVGTVVLGELIGRAYEEGAKEFDFLRGDEDYKWIWADRSRLTHALHGHRRKLVDRVAARLDMIERRARAAAGVLLPAPALVAIRGRVYQRYG